MMAELLWWCRPASVRRCVVMLCVALTICGVIYLGYFCPERVCALSSASVVVVVVSNDVHDQHNASSQLRQSAAASPSSRRRTFYRYAGDDQEDMVNDLVVAEDENVVFNKHAKKHVGKGRPAKRPAASTISVSFDEIANASAATPSTNDDDDDDDEVRGERRKPQSKLFDIRASDVIVFLHIQKTGGTTFGRHLVHDLDLEKPCECTSASAATGARRQPEQQRKRCRCIRPNSDSSYWLFSRFSTGWQCGLHADWTELNGCVDAALDREERATAALNAKGDSGDNDDDGDDDDDTAELQQLAVPSLTSSKRPRRRYFYVTLLREPLVRFLSEFLHVQRGATWKTARHWCGGRQASPRELPSCYEGFDDWEGVSLEEFMACPSNLAINRQTRMLADLSLVGCYNSTAMSARRRDALLLSSAKQNLRRLAYFGLCEQQPVAQYMFEETFRLTFLTPFQQLNETHVTSAFAAVTPDQMSKVRQLNYLDVQLYEYARHLLAHRFEAMRRRDPNFDDHFRAAGQRAARPATKYLPWELESDSN